MAILALSYVFSKESRFLISRACGWEYSSSFQILPAQVQTKT